MSVADQHLHPKEKGEKREFAHDSPAPSREGSTTVPGWHGAASLPEGTAVNADGVPTYMGASGNKLGALVTLAASMGFCLFGGVLIHLFGVVGRLRDVLAVFPLRHG
ncbi:sugar transporter-like protein [Rhodotorula toruloides]|uniref:Uncharacterized protein n=2 Tax=Rhodotorula toruloides TaxID=5286 RepID=A0A2S9ZZI2_RHOTO|nr:hypothetical protein AAT19DRAFT_10705 [Rhodotorula toruloides]